MAVLCVLSDSVVKIKFFGTSYADAISTGNDARGIFSCGHFLF